METLWQTQRRSAACGLLSGVFLVTAVVLSRRISGDAGAFSSELAACLTGVAASLVGILAASLPDLISVRLARPQRTLLISACGLPGIMLGLAVMPTGSSTGLACVLGLYVAAVLTLSAFESEGVRTQPETLVRSKPEPSTVNDQSSSVIAASEKPRTISDAISSDTITLDERLALRATDFEADVTNDSLIGDSENEEPTDALPFELNEPLPHPASNPETTQWMSRSQAEGLDVAEGSFRVRFAASQRLAPVHLPFSPPLADTPEFECEPADDSDLRFRTTAVHAYGIRIEVSRSADSDEEAVVEVAWMASASLSDSVAA
jgi:hypothetical protein